MTSKSKTLSELQQELNSFLEKHPHLQKMQDEIDRRLNSAESQKKRIDIMSQIISEHMEANIGKLNDAAQELNKIKEEIWGDILKESETATKH